MSKKAKYSLYVFALLAVVAAFGYYKLYWDISFSPTKDASFADGIYVPENLEDCHNELDRGLSRAAKRLLAADPDKLTKLQRRVLFCSLDHFSLGMWMRNNWGLWQKGPLAKYFNELGIYHPDDMSSIIMDSYIAKLRGERYDIDEAISTYHRYWQQVTEPNNFIDPNTGGLVTLVDSKSMYHRGNRVIHKGVNKANGKTWFYEHNRGWYEPNEYDLELSRNAPQEE